MIIKYDKEVLADARRIASRPGATQKDLLRHISDHDETAYGFCIPYLNPETQDEIYTILQSLPRRKPKH